MALSGNQDINAILNTAPNNAIIQKTLITAKNKLEMFNNIVCSISGGSDSDIMLDLIERTKGKSNVTYVFFNTGIEYSATIKHLNELEDKYGIVIKRIKPKYPVPLAVNKYGVPFISKNISNMLSRLQKHNFDFTDADFEILYSKYPRCKNGLSWWCDANGEKSHFSISRNKLLKEFIIDNPLNFRTSDKCCHAAKKNIALKTLRSLNADLNIIGVRRDEGG